MTLLTIPAYFPVPETLDTPERVPPQAPEGDPPQGAELNSPEMPEGDLPQEPDTVHLEPPATEPNTTTRTAKQPNAVPEVIDDQHEESLDPKPTQPSYREISTIRVAIILGSIIAGNCLCSGFICLCLWGFAKIDDLTLWEKRLFNTLSLLLSASLGFGIGLLCDQIGSLARGTLLRRKCYNIEGVCTMIPVAKCVIALSCGYGD